MSHEPQSKTQIGLKQNISLFIILVFVNLFVGAMIGLERTVLPIMGEESFGLASTTVTLSFIVTFGFTKALINYFAGRLADRLGRKQVLIFGWIVGLFAPLIVIWAPSWEWIVFANVLLGINQGLAWTMTVNMKVDIVRPNQRGLAIGLNEFAGYSGLSIMAIVSGYVAAVYALRPEPFLIGIVIGIIGLILSLFVSDTGAFIKQEERLKGINNTEGRLSASDVFKLTTWKNRTLSSCSFAGLSTNLKDGMAWGLFPIFLGTGGLSVSQIGFVIAIYPAAWGIFQLFTGVISDYVGRKWMIACGMWTQAIGIGWFVLSSGFFNWVSAAAVIGLGTAMVYPTLQAAISDVAAPAWRASSMGVYRMWRDSGYAFGAIFAGLFTDMINVPTAMLLVALFPLTAGMLIAIRMTETLATKKKVMT